MTYVLEYTLTPNYPFSMRALCHEGSYKLSHHAGHNNK
ncbi:unnamed protein product, partial [Adineta steineri]